jgi:hypothetical protein
MKMGYQPTHHHSGTNGVMTQKRIHNTLHAIVHHYATQKNGIQSTRVLAGTSIFQVLFSNSKSALVESMVQFMRFFVNCISSIGINST